MSPVFSIVSKVFISIAVISKRNNFLLLKTRKKKKFSTLDGDTGSDLKTCTFCLTTAYDNSN